MELQIPSKDFYEFYVLYSLMVPFTSGLLFLCVLSIFYTVPTQTRKKNIFCFIYSNRKRKIINIKNMWRIGKKGYIELKLFSKWISDTLFLKVFHMHTDEYK